MNIPYHLALRLGRLRRRWYQSRLAGIAGRSLPSTGPALPIHFFGFSSHFDLPEQVACLRSLFVHAGVPERVTIVSDGSHTAEDLAILARLPFRPVVVPFQQFICPSLPAPVMRYASQHPLGKKLAVLLSLRAEGAFMYSDSDILFFPGAEDLRRQLADRESAGAFLPDCYPSFDPRMIVSDEEKKNPVNAGFFFLNRPIDWSAAMERFCSLPGDAMHFSEQTTIHLGLSGAGTRALPADRYVLANDDQWLWRDLHAGPRVALRHYISSFRHKFWMRVRH